MAGWLGEFSRNRRIHSHFAGAGIGRTADSVDQWQANRRLAGRSVVRAEVSRILNRRNRSPLYSQPLFLQKGIHS
jgi:hypothetical protein